MYLMYTAIATALSYFYFLFETTINQLEQMKLQTLRAEYHNLLIKHSLAIF